MKKIITTIVLGLTICISAAANEPKYHLASVPSNGFIESREKGHAACTPASAIRTYKNGSGGGGFRFTPGAGPGKVSTAPSVRTSKTIISHKAKHEYSSSTSYDHKPTVSTIVTSSATSNSSSTQYGSSESALGLKSSASTNSSGTTGAGGSSSGGGNANAGVTYGRTSSTATSYVGWYVAGTGSGGSSSFDAETNGSDGGGGVDGDENAFQVAITSATPPTTGTDPKEPLGDAILPLLLLMSLVGIYKWKFKK